MVDASMIISGSALLASVGIYLSSASRSRTNEQIKALKEDIEEAKNLVKTGDEAEERRRTEALRDLDARTFNAISNLRTEIMGRFDDLKSAVLAAVTAR
jgi:hypothetical protein